MSEREPARTFLPLIYNVVGRALNGHPDADGVVREVLSQATRDLSGMPPAESARARILAIAVHRIGARRQRPAAEPGPQPDFGELTVQRLNLTGERRQVAEAGRWLDDDDRGVLALWWQEAAGELTRVEVATAMDAGLGYATGRIQRMRTQLDRCRILVAALEAEPRCPGLTNTVGTWNGRPDPRWRTRIDQHVRNCRTCLSRLRGETPVDRLLAGCPLVPVPASLIEAAGVASAAPAATGSPAATAGPVRRRSGVKVVVATVTAVAAVAGGVAAYAAMPKRSQATAHPVVVAPSATTGVAPSAAVSAGPSPGRTGCAGRTSSSATRFTLRGNGTVRDDVSCLQWQRKISPGVYSFTAAKAYCVGLHLAGSGWRLPSRVELTSIVDSTRPAPAIDRTAFPNTPPKLFWTSTPTAGAKTAPQAWAVDFATGRSVDDAGQSGRYRVRCVRS